MTASNLISKLLEGNLTDEVVIVVRDSKGDSAYNKISSIDSTEGQVFIEVPEHTHV